jgi:hypothetical protein
MIGSDGHSRRHKRFVHNCPSKWKSRQDFSHRLNLEEEMEMKHLNFLALTLVILIIKVKVIIKKR